MIPAIALIGPPAGGKSTLIQPYLDNAIQIGEYTKTLPENDSRKQHCHQHWQEGTKFCLKLVGDLLETYPMPETDWVMLDGTPRSMEQMPIVAKYFNLRGGILITINPEVWMERARLSAGERTDRYDSSLSKLLKRKAEYESDLKRLRTVIPWHDVDNSGELSVTRRLLSETIEKILD